MKTITLPLEEYNDLVESKEKKESKEKESKEKILNEIRRENSKVLLINECVHLYPKDLCLNFQLVELIMSNIEIEQHIIKTNKIFSEKTLSLQSALSYVEEIANTQKIKNKKLNETIYLLETELRMFRPKNKFVEWLLVLFN